MTSSFIEFGIFLVKKLRAIKKDLLLLYDSKFSYPLLRARYLRLDAN